VKQLGEARGQTQYRRVELGTTDRTQLPTTSAWLESRGTRSSGWCARCGTRIYR